jgi:hypothetical protein
MWTALISSTTSPSRPDSLGTYREIDVSMATGSPSLVRTTRRNLPKLSLWVAGRLAAGSSPRANGATTKPDRSATAGISRLRNMGKLLSEIRSSIFVQARS